MIGSLGVDNLQNSATVSLSQLVDTIIFNTKRIGDELLDVSKKGKFQIKAVGLSLSYYDLAKKSLPQQFSIRSDPWLQEDIRRFFKENDRKVIINARDISERPKEGVFKLHFVVKI